MSVSFAETEDFTNRNALIKGSIMATWALGVIAVCLRFLARRLSKARLWYDDWLTLPATVSIPLVHNRSNYVENLENLIKLICVSALRRGVVLHLYFLE